jgi:hypothetical protein
MYKWHLFELFFDWRLVSIEGSIVMELMPDQFYWRFIAIPSAPPTKTSSNWKWPSHLSSINFLTSYLSFNWFFKKIVNQLKRITSFPNWILLQWSQIPFEMRHYSRNILLSLWKWSYLYLYWFNHYYFIVIRR